MLLFQVGFTEMGGGEKGLLNFHRHLSHLHHHGKKQYRDVPKGAITIPCHVEEFRYVQGMIDRDHSLHHQNHHHHHHHGGCFRV